MGSLEVSEALIYGGETIPATLIRETRMIRENVPGSREAIVFRAWTRGVGPVVFAFRWREKVAGKTLPPYGTP
jgi:hypothetical protein